MRNGTIAALAAGCLLIICGSASAQGTARKPRRQFVSVSLDTFTTQPLHFAKWPVEELVGRDVSDAQQEPFDYRSRDGLTTVDVLEFKKRGGGFGVTVYPFGLSSGPTLGIRLSREDLPDIRIALSGPANVPSYNLVDAYAIDVAAQLVIADRSPGWGLGSHAFLGGGVGKVRAVPSDGARVFGEGGGGITVGPFGVELAVKFAFNSFDVPLEHHFVTVPVALRASVTF